MSKINYLSFRLLFAAILLLSFSGCKKDSLCNCFETKGTTISETRVLPEFRNIELNNNVDIILRSGTTYSAVVTCGENLIDGIETEVIDDKLFIRNKNKCNWLRDFKNKFTVEITYVDIDFITNKGSGNLTCADTIKTSFLQVDNWNGTGVMDFVIDCNEVYYKLHTGPADINSFGITDFLYIYSTGNGFVKATQTNSTSCQVISNSTGDCEINTSQKLDASIRYNGNVYYKGNPPLVQSEITGTGKLIPL